MTDEQGSLPGKAEEMSNALIPLQDVEKMSVAVAKSGLFGMKTSEQALALMLLAQAEGVHPMIAARDWHIIQGRPAKKAEAILSSFQERGGVVEWLEYGPAKVVGKFWHPEKCPKPVTITWTIERAKGIGLTAKDNWRNYPEAMLRSRCIAEGVRTVYPSAMQGTMAVEEAEDIEPEAVTMKPEVAMPQAISQEKPREIAPERSSNAEEAEIVPEADPEPVEPETAFSGQIRGILLSFRIRTGTLKNGKNKGKPFTITEYTVRQDDLTEITVKNFGEPVAEEQGAILVFGDLEESVFNGVTQYLAKTVEVEGGDIVWEE